MRIDIISSVTTIILVGLLPLLSTITIEEGDDAVMFVMPSAVINLESDRQYTVGCTLKDESLGNSSSLRLKLEYKTVVPTEVHNQTTIIHNVDLSSEDDQHECGIRRYACYAGRAGLNNMEVNVGRSPSRILRENFTCISEHERRLQCQFPSMRSCDDNTEYHLYMILDERNISCDVRIDRDRDLVQYDSETPNDNLCGYPHGVESLKFGVYVNNAFGSVRSYFELHHADIVKPDKVHSLKVLKISSTSAEISWEQSAVSATHYRKYEFKLIIADLVDREEFIEQPRMTLKHTVAQLIPYTSYRLEVRNQLVPRSSNRVAHDDLYWSGWASLNFTTTAGRPTYNPVMFPGAYSYKDYDTIVEVYWQAVPKKHSNGPGLGYQVEAVSDSGKSYPPESRTQNTTSAVFKGLPRGHYRIRVTSYNDEGPAQGFSEMHIHPPFSTELQPKINRVLRDGNYTLSWFPADYSSITQLLTNYTVMVCNGKCPNSISFAYVSSNTTSYTIAKHSQPYFAIAANYVNDSSGLVWQECVVSKGQEVAPPEFEFDEVRNWSFNIRIEPSCIGHSGYKHWEVHVYTKDGWEKVFERKFRTLVTTITVNGLRANTEYYVSVAAFNGKGESKEMPKLVRTASLVSLWLIILFVLCCLLILAGITHTLTRGLKKVLDIDVELPRGLLEDAQLVVQDDSEHSSSNGASSQSNDVSEDNAYQEQIESDHPPAMIPIPEEAHSLEDLTTEPLHYQEISPPVGITPSSNYIEMDSVAQWKVKPKTVCQNGAIGNGYVQMPHVQSASKDLPVRSTANYAPQSAMKVAPSVTATNGYVLASAMGAR